MCAACALLLAAGGAAAQTLTLPQTLAAARNNVEVAIARGGLAAARADILAANHAPLPVLSGKLSSIDLDKGIGAGGPMKKKVDKGIGIDFVWERGDKRPLRTRAAEQLADAAQADVDDVVQQQLLAAQGAFLDLLAAQERVALVDALAQDTRQLAVTAQRRVKAGDVAAQDASRLEIEAERAQADAQTAALDRQRAALALAQLIGQTTGGERLAAQGDWSLLASPPAADVTALVQARPEVRAAALRVQAAQLALDGARALRQSDVTWGVSYDHYPGTSRALVELRAQMPLQWGYAYEGEIGRALAVLRQAEDTQDKVVRDATVELQRMQLEAGNTLARARRYEGEIMPRARAVAQTAEQAYQRGAIGLTDLLDARRTLRSALIDAVATRLEAARALGAWQLSSRPADDPLPPVSSSSSRALP